MIFMEYDSIVLHIRIIRDQEAEKMNNIFIMDII